MSAVWQSCIAELWRLSWQASALVALVLVAQFVAGQRLPARWRYNLWLLVVIRLVLPWSWSSPLSVYNAINWGTAQAGARIIPEARQPTTAPPPGTAAGPLPETVAAPEAAPEPAVSKTGMELASTPSDSAVPERPRFAAPMVITSVAPRRAFPRKDAMILIWAAGALGLAAHVLASAWRMKRRVRAAVLIEDPLLLTLLEECGKQMRLRVLPSLRETTAIASPALFGFFRPHLLLPRGLAQRLSPRELRHVFLHELAHVCRRDLPLNWLLTLLQILHWFNPVIWLGLARMRADRELACDALAIECGNGHAQEYGRTIIKLLESTALPAPAPGMIGILESKSQMARRIRMIAHFRGGKRRPLLAIALTAVLAVIGLTDAARIVKAEVARAIEPEKTLRVTVCDAETGQPVPGAAVHVPFGSNLTVAEPAPPIRSDAAGLAVIPVASLNSGFLVVHPDYAPAAWERNPRDQSANPPTECVIKLERGKTIGGLVQNEAGQPLAGIHVELRGMSEIWRADGLPAFQQYPAYRAPYCPESVTDAAGRWTCVHFPMDVQAVQLIFNRPGGSQFSFHSKSPRWFSALGGSDKPFTLDEAREGELVSVLPEGTDVLGLVRDAGGRPLAGITVTERDHRHRTPVAVLKTDGQGRFSLPHRDPHQILLTLAGDGFATAVRVISIAPGLAEQVFAMAPAAPLRVRVLDEAGHAIAGATVAPTELDLGWIAKTDAQGLILWPAAPRESLPYTVQAEKFPVRVLQLVPNDSEIIVTLRSSGVEGTEVTVKPLGEDGRPLAQFTVLVAYQGNTMGKFEDFELLGEGRDGALSAIVPAERSNFGFRLKVQATDREPYFSGVLDPLAGEPLLNPTLHAAESLRPGQPIHGKVLLPDGQPAARASVILTHTEGAQSSIQIIHFSDTNLQVEGRDAEAVRTETDGRYSLPMAAPDAPVLLIHEKGFLSTTFGQLAQTPEIRLEPWGIVEGKFSVNGEARAGQRMNLQPRFSGKSYSLYFSIDQETDREGHFRFALAPVGPCILSATSRNSSGESPRAWRTLVEVKSGETTRADCAGVGRTVVGHVQLSVPDAALDWEKDVGTALLADSRAEGNYVSPYYEDFVRQRDYLDAFSRPRVANDLYVSTYPLLFEPDGSFRAEGIPPGSYRIKVTAVRTNPARRNDSKEIGALDQEIVVPRDAANARLDLGNFSLPLTGELPPRPPVITLAATSLAGQPVSLADYSGKQVLLLFWATWAPPSAELLAQWKRLYEAHGTDPRFVMLGVSLDNDAAAAQRFADAHQWHWPQARLEGSQKAAITEMLEVNDLPTALLMGPNARLVGRNLSEARLRAAIESFLTSIK